MQIKHQRNIFRIQEQLSLKVQQNSKPYKRHPILKITIKLEFIPNPKYIISIVNVYASTSQLVGDDVSMLESFYNEFKNKSLLFLTGDCNAKVGKKIKQHASSNCIGSYGRVVRNNNR